MALTLASSSSIFFFSSTSSGMVAMALSYSIIRDFSSAYRPFFRRISSISFLSNPIFATSSTNFFLSSISTGFSCYVRIARFFRLLISKSRRLTLPSTPSTFLPKSSSSMSLGMIPFSSKNSLIYLGISAISCMANSASS